MVAADQRVFTTTVLPTTGMHGMGIVWDVNMGYLLAVSMRLTADIAGDISQAFY